MRHAKARSNIEIAGAGEDRTTLYPVGSWKETGLYATGIDMFAFDGLAAETYLQNADFRDFTIDGSCATGDPKSYNASGKGFFFPPPVSRFSLPASRRRLPLPASGFPKSAEAR